MDTAPKPDARQEYLLKLLNHLIDTHTKKRGQARSAARLLKISLIVLGGVTTVLIGLREFGTFSAIGETLGIVTLILSALATGLVAWDGFDNSGWKWAHYRDMLLRLYMIRDQVQFDANAAGGLTADLCQAHFNSLQALLSEDRDKWQSVRASNITGRKA